MSTIKRSRLLLLIIIILAYFSSIPRVFASSYLENSQYSLPDSLSAGKFYFCSNIVTLATRVSFGSIFNISSGGVYLDNIGVRGIAGSGTVHSGNLYVYEYNGSDRTYSDAIGFTDSYNLPLGSLVATSDAFDPSTWSTALETGTNPADFPYDYLTFPHVFLPEGHYFMTFGDCTGDGQDYFGVKGSGRSFSQGFQALFNYDSFLYGRRIWSNLGGFSFDYIINDTAALPPAPVGCTVDCFSNVLFFPGLEASRLYTTRNGGSEDQLWEPNGNSDAEDLYLNTDGSSGNQNIYTRDIIGESNTPFSTGAAGQNIYKSFGDMMDKLVGDGKITAWQPFAYDWRQDVQDIVDNGTQYQDGNKSLVATLQSLVDSSKNGKVTLIAHSNGGLLAKALLKKLQDDKAAGTNNLIDDVDVLILVAVPEIGTAKALPAIMHGYDGNIAGGWLMDKMRTRELGRNMPGAYGLLPSREYINHVDASPVTFTDTVIPSNVTTKFVETFGYLLDSYDKYKSFLFGGEGRTDPSLDQINLPISLSQSLFAKAESLHDKIDNWTPPATMRVIEVAGWGLDTVASFKYYPAPCIVSPGCGYTLDERPIFTTNGDKTVVVPSAHYSSFQGSAEKYWVDLPEHNAELGTFRRNREHKDILEVTQLNNFIKSIIDNEIMPFDLVFRNTEPQDTSDRLRLSVHSPVTFDAFDAEGNHTGKICPPYHDFCFNEENILNSSYLEFGEGKYINLPFDQMSEVKLQGTAIGTFTYISEKVSPDGASITSSFINIPVTTQTQAEITMSATQEPEMALDVTGDGVSDFTVTPNSTFDPILSLQIMKTTVDSLDLPQAKIIVFNNRIDNVIKSIQKGKIDQAKLKAEKFTQIFTNTLSKSDSNNPKPHRLSKDDAQILLDMLNRLLDNIN